MKKRIILISIGAFLLVSIIVTVIVIFPYIRLLKYANTLKNEKYAYTCQYNLEYKGSKNYNFTGTIKGYRDEPYTYGKIYLEDTKVTEVYVSDEGEALFNLKPIILMLIDKVSEEHSEFNILRLTVKNTYVSLNQCKDLLGVDTQAIIDENLASNYKVKCISKIPETKYIDIKLKDVQGYKINTSTEIEEIIFVLGKDENGNTVGNVIIDDENLYLEATLNYDTKDTDDIKFPEESFSSFEINVFETIYKLFK